MDGQSYFLSIASENVEWVYRIEISTSVLIDFESTDLCWCWSNHESWSKYLYHSNSWFWGVLFVFVGFSVAKRL